MAAELIRSGKARWEQDAKLSFSDDEPFTMRYTFVLLSLLCVYLLCSILFKLAFFSKLCLEE